ncbi:calcium-dependent lipid-binding (CaLB domain) family protein [Actinidia rufa]|uniref:Calcium-dependent lipid-binding (CaLB domain) family protein n=1 Tax=Actinidia rufa TaxID=165716 RepID=A0A7J0ESX2_9ERIC|nr:calcium-dependent lipid-binding (CaLB domain) family protein [Actinidia rufa]
MSITGIQGQLLEITVVGCNKLKDTEWISRQDPYVCLDYGGTKYRTRTCTDGGKNPTFQEKFTFTLIEGLPELGLVVWNSNTVNYDDFIGSGKSAGEVKLIMHYANANAKAKAKAKANVSSIFSAFNALSQLYAEPSVPHGHLYSTPPPASAASYPSLIAAYPTPSPYPSYPHHTPHSSGYPPAPYHPPPQPSAYPPQYPTNFSISPTTISPTPTSSITLSSK